LKHVTSEVILNLDGTAHALAILKALKPETTLPATQRSTVEIRRRGRMIHLRFEAKDIVALRACMNAILRYVLGLSKTTASFRELNKNANSRPK